MSLIAINLQVLFSGLALGAIYALVALGFVLIIRATNVVNFAQGDFAMLGAYAMLTLLTFTEATAPGLTPTAALAQSRAVTDVTMTAPSSVMDSNSCLRISGGGSWSAPGRPSSWTKMAFWPLRSWYPGQK